MKDEKKYLGGKIHKLLNNTLARKLTLKEYSQLIVLIGEVFKITPSKNTK